MEKSSKKVRRLTDIVKIARRAQRRGLRVVTTNGCFDLLHIGHVRNLEAARSLGDLLIVGVNSDASVRTIKGRARPIVPVRERAAIVAALDCVDYVFIFGAQDPRGWLSKIRPDIHVKGSDRMLKDIPEANVVKKYGGKIKRVPLVKGKSTSRIIGIIVRRFS